MSNGICTKPTPKIIRKPARVRSVPELIAAPALPYSDVALLLDLPLSTVDKLRAQGKGPRTFKIGRRLYVRQGDLREWLDRLAESEAV